ncbi:MAG: protein translocase subunit SecF [Myxococcales bacterium]|nr:protein translocase subunit SecF [Myxococcales bacterium]MCB9642998.1 protein translocase subunit SecF [Myxococcales bacterium]
MERKFFQVVSPDVNYEFVGMRRKFMGFSGVLFIASLVLVFTRGLNFGIDFSGGTEIQVRFNEKVPAAKLQQGQILKDFDKAMPDLKKEIQSFGADGREFLFKFETISILKQKANKKAGEKDDVDKLKDAFYAAFADKAKAKGKDKLTIRAFRFREEGGDRVEVRFNRPLQASKKKAPTSKPSSVATSKATSAPVAKVDYTKIADETDRIRQVFRTLGLGQVEVGEPSGGKVEGYEYTLTFSGLSGELEKVLKTLYGTSTYKIERVESVGPRVGHQLRDQGLLAILLAMFFILIYIAIRFDFRYAPGAVAALLHDVVITMGVFSALYVTFDLSIIAALLTIIGYSLNDTIVVFDRIRENWQKSRVDFAEVMNRSINETLSRTLLTSLTTFIAVTPIYLVGGSNIRWFSFAMMFGILIGTYSSIAIASPFVFYLDQYFSRQEREEEEAAVEKRETRRLRRKGITT